MFCDRKYWYEERRNKDWNDFLPCLESYNEKRKRLFMTVLVMLDESMSGWRPKTSKFGGLPNLTYKPRKPVPLGTQFKNAVEGLSGCFVYQDVVQPAKLQQWKHFFYPNPEQQTPEKTSLPGHPNMQAHTAEVLWLVNGAGVVRGGWCGGDAWFGSVMTSLELWYVWECILHLLLKTTMLSFQWERCMLF